MKISTEIDVYLCSLDTPLVEVLSRINAAEGLCQIVVDADRRFIGTITDGDIRRAILMGTNLEDTAIACAFRDATVCHASDSTDEIQRRLLSIDYARPFVPVLDTYGHVVSIALPDKNVIEPPFGLIMAGGRGTRLGKRTNTVPKPLLEVGGEPMLGHILRALDEAEVDPIFISVHYLADKIEKFVAEWTGRAEIILLHEEQPLGTAGALGLVPDDLNRPVFVMNADVLTNLDIRGMMAYHRRHSHVGTVAIATHEIVIPYGVIEQTEDGLFDAIREKPRISNFVSSGIYMLEPTFHALAPKNRRLDMPELLDRGKKMGMKIGLYPVHEYWTDIGHPEDLDAADQRMRDINESD